MTTIGSEARRSTPTPFSGTYQPPARTTRAVDARGMAVWRHFDLAAEQVWQGIEKNEVDHWTLAGTQECLAHLQAMVRCAASNAPMRTRQFPVTVDACALLDELRASFLSVVESSDAEVDAKQTVAVLQGIERAHQLLRSDDAQRLSSQISQRTGQQLIIEVAHDMRSPLGSVMLLADQLRTGRSGPVSETQLRQLGLIYSASLGLSTLVNDLLELAHGGNRLMHHEPIPFSIAEVLQSVRDIVQPFAEEKGLRLAFSLPESDSRMGSPAALSRVLLNLTTNALKFTGSGTVTVACRQLARTQFEFSVSDTGRGIPSAVCDALFDAFRPNGGDSAERTFSSAGLGLHICRTLVHAMGSSLGVDSMEGAGTRFHFDLELPSVPV